MLPEFRIVSHIVQCWLCQGFGMELCRNYFNLEKETAAMRKMVVGLISTKRPIQHNRQSTIRTIQNKNTFRILLTIPDGGFCILIIINNNIFAEHQPYLHNHVLRLINFKQFGQPNMIHVTQYLLLFMICLFFVWWVMLVSMIGN